ncbi:MAG: cation-translocating P-type ATPase [Acidobacteriota bacterium]|jgi:Ca2+-transporting ATPase|nr:cation-translocating P-type ATPase [Acidobacteriota bacterium]NLT32283.1 cation-translocating P-type ATPase [Acidobacteriota bacterium]
MKNEWHTLAASDVLEILGSDASRGLPDEEIPARRLEHGWNELEEKEGRTRWQILAEQLSGVLTVLLLVAALVSGLLGDWLEAVVILGIVLLNAVFGYMQEARAEQSMAALRRMAVPVVRVRRGGRVLEASARDLVPGDIVLLEDGNIVPADGRILEGVNLRVDESALTGESEPVEKAAEIRLDAAKTLGDRRNMVYSGTVVGYGRGAFVVTETGMRTELGHVAHLIQSVEGENTPLQRRLNRLGKTLAQGALGLVALVFLLGWIRAESSIEELLLTAVSLAVAAVPEALTAVVTIALSLGAQRMLRRKALIRKLPAVETLGSVTRICSDKTGTLTLNRMSVIALDVADHTIRLDQYDDGGAFTLKPSGEIPPPGVWPTLDLLLVAGALCNDAALAGDGTPGGLRHAVGDPTEGALVLAAACSGILKDDLARAFPRIGEVPFDSVRKRMTTLHRSPLSDAEVPESLRSFWERRNRAGTPPFIAFTKGAMDGMIPVCSHVWVEGESRPLDDAWKRRIQASHDDMAAQGMRVLAVGMRPWDRLPEETKEEAVENGLILLGLFGMIDPPRPEVGDAVARCHRAGIRTAMITGDHPLTARHIARQIGIVDNDLFLTGAEIERLSAEELVEATRRVSVFARVSPEHKLKLIDAYQSRGEVVSMTGDGVNDAPALKKADIGVAMGITGTDVAKNASDMILLDDNFATIVAAVEEGRIIYDNIRRFIRYLLTCNASEIAVMLLGPLLGMPLPLLPLQILWMNLVTDGAPALALGVESAEKNVMQRPPHPRDSGIFSREMISFIGVIGFLMSVIAIGTAWELWRSGDPAWQTTVFTVLVLAQLVVALEARSEEESLLRMGVFGNRAMVLAVMLTAALQAAVIYTPVGNRIFTTVPMSPADLAIAAGTSLLTLLFIEAWKFGLRRRRRKARGL